MYVVANHPSGEIAWQNPGFVFCLRGGRLSAVTPWLIDPGAEQSLDLEMERKNKTYDCDLYSFPGPPAYEFEGRPRNQSSEAAAVRVPSSPLDTSLGPLKEAAWCSL